MRGRSGGYPGDIGVAEFAGDAGRRVGTDGGRVRIPAAAATDERWVNGTIKHDDTVAFGLNGETENSAGSARDQQKAHQAFFFEYLHDIHSFICKLAPVSCFRNRAKAVPPFEYRVDSMV